MKKVIFMLMTLSLMFASCSSETTESTDQGVKSIETSKVSKGLKGLRDKALSDINIGGTVYYDSKEGAIFYTKTKSHIIIPANSIRTKSGTDINGEIEIEYIEIFNKEKMVVTNKPTMGQISGQNRALLVTGGEFYLDIKFKGEQVEVVKPIKVNIETTNSQADPSGMVLWNGDINGNDDLTWIPAPTSEMSFQNDGAVFSVKGGQFYDVLINSSLNFGWCNIDKILNLSGPRTKIDVKVPANFNHTNSGVYVIVKSQNNALVQFNAYDSGTSMFREEFGVLPIGTDCYILFLAEVNGNYVYEIIPTTLPNNAVYSISTSNLVYTTSYQEVETAIQALP